MLGQRKLVLFYFGAVFLREWVRVANTAVHPGRPCSGAGKKARSVQWRERRSQHDAGLVAIAVLDVDHRGVDALTGYIFQRNRPATGISVPVAHLEQATHHVVVGHLTAAILTAADRDRHSLGN